MEGLGAPHTDECLIPHLLGLSCWIVAGENEPRSRPGEHTITFYITGIQIFELSLYLHVN